MKIIGLTGGVASGKTTVAYMLKELGAEVIDADDLARKAVEPGQDAYNKIVKVFGKEILEENGNLNRKNIREIIFTNKEKKQILEEIIHPTISAMLNKAIEKEREKGTVYLVLDIPLFFEAGMQAWISPVVLVYADKKTRITRLIERDKISEGIANSMIDSQMLLEEKKKLSDFVIDNNKDLNNTKNQVRIIWEKILKGAEWK